MSEVNPEIIGRATGYVIDTVSKHRDFPYVSSPQDVLDILKEVHEQVLAMVEEPEIEAHLLKVETELT